METILGLRDLILTPSLFAIVYFVGYRYAKLKYGDSVLAKHFIYGLVLKMLGSIVVGFVFMFVYVKGDTFVYYYRCINLTGLFLDNPFQNWVVFFPEFFHDTIINIPRFYISNLDKANSYMVIRIAAFLNIFLFDSYFAIGILFSLFSFIGSWKLYKVFYYYYPSLTKQIAISVLYLPGIIIWGSGIFKDTITFGSTGILIYVLHSVVIRKKLKISYIVYGLISFYLIGIVKPYILMTLVPSLIFFLINYQSSKIQSTFVRTSLLPLVLVIVALASFGALSALSETFTAYNIDNMEQKLEGFQRWHTVRSEQTEGAGYSLGGGGTSPIELLAKFPLAVNVTLFRPYLWEARKPIVFLAALESLYVLFVTIQSIRMIGLRGIAKLLFSNPFISFCFVFSIIFSFAVGISAYNFGALVRFKIPCMPFYLMSMFMSRQETTSN